MEEGEGREGEKVENGMEKKGMMEIKGRLEKK